MIDKEFLKSQMIRLEANYGKERFKITKPMFELWLDMFSKYDANGFKMAVDEYMRTSEFPPSVASINNVYNRLSEDREHLKKKLMAKYKWASYWFEETPNRDSYNTFVSYVCKYPMNEREKRADDLVLKAVSYWNDCAEKGVPKQARFNLKEYIEGLDNGC